MKKRALFRRQVFGNGMIASKRDDPNLSFALIPHRAQTVELFTVEDVGINEEEEAARDIHRFDDETDRHVGETLHIEDVADLLAVRVERAAGIELL